jgi:hypothetical protein
MLSVSITFSHLPDESSWTYRAGFAWLLVAGIHGTIATVFAVTLIGLPVAFVIWLLFILPAVTFANSFLAFRSALGAASATIAATLFAALGAFGVADPLAAIPLGGVAVLSALGLREIRAASPTRSAGASA